VQVMRLRGDYFHVLSYLYLGKRSPNHLKLTTENHVAEKSDLPALSVQCMQLSSHDFSGAGFG
jgi:hypothetical protein